MLAGANEDALRLLASSSSACFLASACLSLQVNFLPEDEGDGDIVCSFCCSNWAKGFFNFFGAARDTGVYELFNGSILSSSAGFVGTLDCAENPGVDTGGGVGALGGGAGTLLGATGGDELAAGF